MEASVQKIEAQLRLWSSKIDRLAAETHIAGTRSGFDALTYIDELKALHAIAQATFDEYRAAEEMERTDLYVALKRAGDELAAAFRTPKPSP